MGGTCGIYRGYNTTFNKNKTGNIHINVIQRRVRVTIVAVEKQYYIF
jgi:hypothetical protein